jgi:hypothetical protein
MTRDDIMALANQTAGQHWMDEAHIHRFAALVAAAEREACAKVCDDLPMYGPDDETADWYGFAQVDCAVAIRARGQA